MCSPLHVVHRFGVLLLVGVEFVLSGCGSLNVEMQVLNPAVVRAFLDDELTSKLLPQVIASTPESLRNQVDRLETQHRAAYKWLADTYRKEAENLPVNAKTKLRQLANDLESDVNTNPQQVNFYAALLNDLIGYANNLRKLQAGRAGIAPKDAGYDKVLYMLRQWQQRVTQAERVISEEIRVAGEKLVNEIPGGNAGAALKNAVDDHLSGLERQLTQISIQNSPAAYAVANAPECSWSTSYNQVLTSAKGGTSDVAIRLDNRTGNYLLKGLSFDPSDVAAVAAKVTTQAVLLTAQAAGVPVKTSSTPADGTIGKALAASSGALANAQATLETGRAQDEARRASLLSLAQTIVGEERDLAGDDATRRAAMAAIRNALEKRLTLIRPATTP